MKKCIFSQKKDRISYLPDPIQCHIVSFLPLKDVIRTSILSRQWEHASSSLSIPNLEFDWHSFKNGKFKGVEFRDFIDEILFRHDGSDIQKFSLNVEVDDVFMPFHHISAYVSYAVDHNVQEIELVMSFNCRSPRMLPRRFFTSKTLTVLNLASVEMEWPSVVKFPALKSLTFSEVRFEDEETLDNLALSSNCPVLEDLSILFCEFPEETTVSISNPSLKVLKVLDVYDLIFKMSTTTLRELECMVLKPLNFSCENFSSLASASFNFTEDFDYPEIALDLEFSSATELIKYLGRASIEKLALKSGITEILSRGEDLGACLPPPCCSVKHLHLGMWPIKVHFQVITLLLRIYPNIQSLQIYVETPGLFIPDTSKSMDMEEHWHLKELSRENMLNNLRTVELLNFHGNEFDSKTLKYVVENAKFLENLSISSPTLVQKEAGRQKGKETTTELMSWLARDFSNLSITVA